MTIVVTGTVTATAAARDRLDEAIVGTTTTPTPRVAITETGSARIATPAAIAAVAVTGRTGNGTATEVRLVATLDETTTSDSTAGNETSMTDAAAEGITGVMMEASEEGRKAAELLRRHPRRGNQPPT